MMHTGWRADHDETEDDANGRRVHQVEAQDARHAAKLLADRWHSELDGWEWSWPITIRIRDANGKLFDVEVERHSVPEFEASTPVEVVA